MKNPTVTIHEEVGFLFVESSLEAVLAGIPEERHAEIRAELEETGSATIFSQPHVGWIELVKE